MNASAPDTLETCNAVMIGLGPRRFVIVRRDEPTGLCSTAPPAQTGAPAQRVRDLLPGDEVIYKGKRLVVRSIQIYE